MMDPAKCTEEAVFRMVIYECRDCFQSRASGVAPRLHSRRRNYTKLSIAIDTDLNPEYLVLLCM